MGDWTEMYHSAMMDDYDQTSWPDGRRTGRGGKRRSRRRRRSGKNKRSRAFWKHSKKLPCPAISDAQVECLRKLVDGSD